MNATTAPPALRCPAEALEPGKQGLGPIAVDDARATLAVTFLADLTSAQLAYLKRSGSYALTGGHRRHPRVVAVDPPVGRTVTLRLNEIGDFSVYTLVVTGPDIDRNFATRELRFRLGCDDAFDCRTPPSPPAAEPADAVVVDYLTKDYAGFRQALLDFLPTRQPGWTERNEADVGMMLLELFAATADNLSYAQDRVAAEAFLDTARHRRSVAGHLALLGYQLDPGAAAVALLRFEARDAVSVIPTGFPVTSRPGRAAPAVVFETDASLTIRRAHNAMEVLAPPGAVCELPAAARALTLNGAYPDLRAGDYLTIDDGADACDVVRLTRAAVVGSTTVVEWSAATPLRHAYAVRAAADGAAGTPTVRGNVVPATHGETVRGVTAKGDSTPVETLFPVPGDPDMALPDALRRGLRLRRGPLTYVAPGGPGLRPAGGSLTVKVDGEVWEERPSLLDSGPTARHYRVELDDRGNATVRFGKPGAGSGAVPAAKTITAEYRVGGGAVGNVPAGTLVAFGPRGAYGIQAVTNPLPAAGGRDPESRDHARRAGPATFRTPLVALTAADYESAAEAFEGAAGARVVQRATTAFRWTGSWLTATVGVDALNGNRLGAADAAALFDHLNARRLAGYDVALSAQTPAVPVELALAVTAAAGARAADVRAAVLAVLGSGVLPGGEKGFFHPDQFTFGQKLYVSRVYAAVAAVPGVAVVRVTRLCPVAAADPARATRVNLTQGFLAVGPTQVVRLDNDRNQPENGTLQVVVTGGRP